METEWFVCAKFSLHNVALPFKSDWKQSCLSKLAIWRKKEEKGDFSVNEKHLINGLYCPNWTHRPRR